jgi:hypothetical protein
MYRAAQDGQQALFTEHRDKDPAGPEWDYAWVAVIDGNTCEICLDLNDEPPKKIDEWEYNPGDVHFFCRCDWDPVPPEEDEDQPDDGEPNNEGTPGGDEPGPGPEDEPVGTPGDNTPLYEDISDLDAGQREVAMHTMGYKEVESYMRSSNLRTKLDDIKNGKVTIGAYLNKFYSKTEDLMVQHFEAHHGLTLGDAYSSGRWWDGLRTKEYNNEIDMLVRVDTTLDAMKSAGTFKDVFESDDFRNKLNLWRMPTSHYPDGKVIDNTAYYSTASNTVYLHNKTMMDLQFDDLGKNKIIAHEFTHAYAAAAKRSGEYEIKRDWTQVQDGFNKLSDRAVAEHVDGFITRYSMDSFVKDHLGEEDVAEAVAAYIYSPKAFERNDITKAKYDLLKDKLFGGVEFKGYQPKPLL